MEISEIKLFGRTKIKVFPDRPISISQIISDSAKRYGGKKAIVTEDDSLTYQELDTLSTYIAANLQMNCGVKKGDRVAALIGNRVQFPLVLFACAKLGAIMVPVNVNLAVNEIKYILGDSTPKVIISEAEFLNKIVEINKQSKEVIPSEDKLFLIKGQDTFQSLLKVNEKLKPPIVDEDDSAFILYTSGTTGRPKGALISHVGTIHSVMNFKNIFETDSSMTTIIAIPMFHVSGLVAQLLHMVYVGGTSYSMNRYQNDAYIDLMLKHKVNFLFNVPTIFIMLSKNEKFREHSFDFVTKIGFGGSPTYQQTYNLLMKAYPNANLHNAYGATETTSPATLMPVNYPESKYTSVGLPVIGADIKIINSNGDECAIGESGEIFIKGPMVVKGYWKNEEANLASFSDGYWHSGDIGMIDDDGYLYVHDRIKDMINRGGEKIFSIEVEDVLKSHPSILEAAVIGVPNHIYGEIVKAFVVGSDLNSESLVAIQEYCGRHLAKYKVPDEFEILEELPKNASGKILKNTLKTGGVKNS